MVHTHRYGNEHQRVIDSGHIAHIEASTVCVSAPLRSAVHRFLTAKSRTAGAQKSANRRGVLMDLLAGAVRVSANVRPSSRKQQCAKRRADQSGRGKAHPNPIDKDLELHIIHRPQSISDWPAGTFTSLPSMCDKPRSKSNPQSWHMRTNMTESSQSLPVFCFSRREHDPGCNFCSV